MKVLQAKVPENLYKEIEERVKLGLFRDTSEAVNQALKKTLAEQSREYLRDLAKNKRLTETEMLEELKKVRE